MKKLHRTTHPEWVLWSGGPALFDTFPEMNSSGEAVRFLSSLGLAQTSVEAGLVWSTLQWHRSGQPIFRLTEELATALLCTELPKQLETLPPLPFPGFYVACEGVFRVWNEVTGWHRSEGVYVTKDLIRRYRTSPAGEEGITILAVGEDRHKEVGLHRDDALVDAHILPNGLLHYDVDEWEKRGAFGPTIDREEKVKCFESINSAVRIVMNLLLLWSSEGSLIEQKEVRPAKPKSPKKLKRLERRGLSTAKYIRLGFRDRAQGVRVRRIATEGPSHEVLVMGHYRRYWVREPGEAQVLATKEKTNTLYCVRRFVEPHRALRRGERPKKNVYKVNP